MTHTINMKIINLKTKEERIRTREVSQEVYESLREKWYEGTCDNHYKLIDFREY